MGGKRFVAVTTSRNDGDFAEAFIRGNSRYVEKFVILDDSSDNTQEIVSQLRQEGFQIDLIRRPGIVADQAEKINYMVDEFVDPSRFSAVIPLDMDEVLVPANEEIPQDSRNLESEPSFLSWYPFVPNRVGLEPGQDFLRSGFSGTENTKKRVKKVFIPTTAVSRDRRVSIGAHNYKAANGTGVQLNNPHFAIAHFPVRSPDQLMLKLLTGLAALGLKAERAKTEGHHLIEIGRLLRETDFLLDLETLQKIGAFYGFLGEAKRSELTVFNNDSNLLPEIDLSFPELTRINLNRNMLELVNELVSLPGEILNRPRLRRVFGGLWSRKIV